MHSFAVIANYSKNINNLDKKIEDMLFQKDNETIHYSLTSHCLMASLHQPFVYKYLDKTYRIIFDGKLYNANELKNKLLALGFTFSSLYDEEIVLKSYIAWKQECLNMFDGPFAFIIDDDSKLFVARDPLGIQPLYYYQKDNSLIIANEMKSLLQYIGEVVVDQNGVRELLALGPSLTPGHTIYKDIYSLRPAYYLTFQSDITTYQYWSLKDELHTDNLEDTIKKVRELVIESIQKQLPTNEPLSTMLSGGLDSSIITAIAAQYDKSLSTYSVTYQDQDKYFQAYDYQTTMDDDYIKEILTLYPTNHQQITLQQEDLISALEQSLIARDMPGMADVDSSFLLFTQNISQKHHICLSGECADEIFGGYPWFYKEELYNQPYFPWMRNLDLKIDLFNEKVKALNIKDYIIQRYNESLQELPTHDKKKQLIYLNYQWFMQTLLTRAYTQSTINVRVPFASTKIIQYLYNVPLEYMLNNNEEKGLLRKAFEDFLPEDIAHRKKNPYPKTHSPIYTKLIQTKLKESLQDPCNILYQFFDKEKLLHFVETNGESFQSPWFGQLMMGPQLMAYFYQIYLWGKIYKIKLEF